MYEDDTSEGLDFDTLYGLYISWCHLAGAAPVSDGAFGAALTRRGLHRVRHVDHRAFAGLRMVGPAARDYVLHTDPCWSEMMPAGKAMSL